MGCNRRSHDETTTQTDNSKQRRLFCKSTIHTVSVSLSVSFCVFEPLSVCISVCLCLSLSVSVCLSLSLSLCLSVCRERERQRERERVERERETDRQTDIQIEGDSEILIHVSPIHKWCLFLNNPILNKSFSYVCVNACARWMPKRWIYFGRM